MAVSASPAQPPPNQPQQHVEYTAGIGTHGHGRAKQHLSRLRNIDFLSGLLPGMGHVEAEPPRIRHIFFQASENAGDLVVWGIVSMSVDSGGARLQPNPWRPDGSGNGFPDSASGFDSRLFDQATILGVVSAVNTASGQVD